ncbi:hypothetical protein CPC08DRAFT_758677 [Agrocybe pediades]|nr:hypothetical protein CPC08DRAFT_758677 [Agrocybe pediades]
MSPEDVLYGEGELLPVDISQVEASDSVQSHLSTTTSSKRLRGASTSHVELTKDAVDSDFEEDRASPVQRIATYMRKFLGLDTGLLPASGTTRIARVERSWIRETLKYVLILYSCTSCIFAGFQLHGTLSEPVQVRTRVVDSHNTQENVKSVAQYLLRSTSTSSAMLEPYVRMSSHANGTFNVTICGWLPDSKIHLVREWSLRWKGPISLLVTTSAHISSSSHRKLLQALKQSAPQQASIHILHLREKELGPPNSYLNLARLFALTDWTLIMPSELFEPIPTDIQRLLSSTTSGSSLGTYLLASGGKEYPFLESSALLLRKDRGMWCTERLFVGMSRSSDWNECVWQLQLETRGIINSINMLGKNVTMSLTREDKATIAEGVIRQRLIARLRAEMCDITMKQISLVQPRGRRRDVELEWVRTFCNRKTVDRKLSG